MTTEIISPKYQIVIPKEFRKKLKLKPGQKLQVIAIGNNLQFMSIMDIKKARGFLIGIDTEIIREKDMQC